jgi:hypothetical protein
VYGDFYDGMLKYASSGEGIHQHEELGAVTVDEIVRDVHILDLSQNFRAQLERAVEREADLINVAHVERINEIVPFSSCHLIVGLAADSQWEMTSTAGSHRAVTASRAGSYVNRTRR